ncbi:MAG: DUF1365 family protein [Burkholderiales bacterium]
MTSSPASALYVGSVMHQRLRPARHRLQYRVFTLLLDLDELPALSKRLRWFSLNRFNLFSLVEADHGDGVSAATDGLRGWVHRQLQAAGLPADGPVQLLTMPRILGHVFNPLSVYFCHAPDGSLCALLYEVHNTFGQRHTYLIEVPEAERRAARLAQQCDKDFYVSPFMAMALRYRFVVEPPAAQRATLRIGINAADAQGPVLHTQWDTERHALTDAALLHTFATHPLLTLKVVAGIHWEALRLFFKGLRPQPHPAPPASSTTIVRNADT